MYLHKLKEGRVATTYVADASRDKRRKISAA